MDRTGCALLSGRMRRTVLFAPETFNLAEVTRGIEVARRLAPEIRAIFCGFSRRYADRITAAGFAFTLLEPELSDPQIEQLLALDQGRGVRNPLTASVLGRRVAAERHLIRRTQAEAVVIGSTVSQFISARAERVPLSYIKPFAYSAPHIAGLRHIGLSLRETKWQRLWDWVGTRAVRAVAPRIRLLPRGWRAVAARNGVQLPKSSLQFLDADLNLITTAPPVLPSGVPLPPHYRVVGPISARLNEEIPETVLAAAAGEAPVVYVAVGSSGGRELVLPILAGLGGHDLQVVAPVRHLLTDSDRARLDVNVHVTGWLPAHRLGGLVDLAITHGGEGTVQNSLLQGWPMIVTALQWEQRFTAIRCAQLGLARYVRTKDLADADWPSLVREVLSDRPMRSRLQEAQQHLAQLDGPGRAAAQIGELLNK